MGLGTRAGLGARVWLGSTTSPCRIPSPEPRAPISYSPAMLNPTGLYHCVLRRLSRRDSMKAAWTLGASAVALPVEARRQSGVSMVFNLYPFSLGVASGVFAARRHRLVDPARAAAAHRRRHADGPCDRALGAGGRLGLPERSAKRGDPGTPRTGAQRSRRGQRAPARARILVSLPRRERSQPDRGARERRPPPAPTSTACVSGFAAAATTRPATSPPIGASPRSCSTSSSTPATTSTSRAPMAAGNEGRVRQHTGSTTRHAGRLPQPLRLSTNRIPTSSPRTARPPSSSAGTITRSRNNYAGDLDENGTPAAIFLLRRAAAYQAYYEHMPLRTAAWRAGAHMRIFGGCSSQAHRPQRARHASVALGSGVQRRGSATARPRSIRRGRCSARNRRSGSSTISRTRPHAGRCSRSRSTRSPATSPR